MMNGTIIISMFQTSSTIWINPSEISYSNPLFVCFAQFEITAQLVTGFILLEQVEWDGTVDSTVSVISHWDQRSPN